MRTHVHYLACPDRLFHTATIQVRDMRCRRNTHLLANTLAVSSSARYCCARDIGRGITSTGRLLQPGSQSSMKTQTVIFTTTCRFRRSSPRTHPHYDSFLRINGEPPTLSRSTSASMPVNSGDSSTIEAEHFDASRRWHVQRKEHIPA